MLKEKELLTWTQKEINDHNILESYIDYCEVREKLTISQKNEFFEQVFTIVNTLNIDSFEILSLWDRERIKEISNQCCGL